MQEIEPVSTTGVCGSDPLSLGDSARIAGIVSLVEGDSREAANGRLTSLRLEGRYPGDVYCALRER